MSDQVQVDLIVKAIATGFEKLSKGFIDIEKANKDAAGALSTFGVNLNALDNPITAIAQGMKAAIDETVKWAGDIDKLARNTGLSATEASKFAIVAGDVGIEIGTLERALKAMTKDGLELNMESLKKLSREYNALKSPVDRMAFATDHFGAAAQDMTEILSRSSEELDELARAAENSGKVMDEEAIANAEKFEQSLAQLQDRVDGLKVVIGGGLIDTLNAYGDSVGNILKIQALLAVEFQRNTGQIDALEASQRAAAIAAGDLGAAFEEQIPVIHDVNERVNDTSLAEARLTEQIDVAKLALLGYGSTASDVVIAQQELKLSAEQALGVYSTGIGIIDASNLAESEKLRIQTALKLASGELTLEELARQQAVSNLTQAFIDGKISEQEYIDGMAELARQGELTSISLGNVLQGLNALPDTKTITINTVENGNYGNVVEPTGTNPYSDYGPGGGTTSSGNGYATGVYGMVVPPGYPNDTYPMRVQSGEVVDVWKSPAERARAMGGGGGGDTVNIYDGRAYALWREEKRQRQLERANSLMGG